MKKFTIAIIDSGLGGLSLFDTFLSQLNVKNYVYFADLKNLPYGSKTKEELICITLKNVRNIITRYRPNALVFGCNTIGTTIFENIKNSFTYLPMFAIRPNLKKITVSNNAKTLVLATTATIKGLSKSQDYLKNKSRIVLCKMPRLATKIEDYMQNGTNLVPYLKNKFKNLKQIDKVVLGCTHYYFVKDIIASFFPKARIIDGSTILTKEIKNRFKLKTPSTKVNPKIKWNLTANQNSIKQYKKIVQKLIKN